MDKLLFEDWLYHLMDSMMHDSIPERSRADKPLFRFMDKKLMIFTGLIATVKQFPFKLDKLMLKIIAENINVWLESLAFSGTNIGCIKVFKGAYALKKMIIRFRLGNPSSICF